MAQQSRSRKPLPTLLTKADALLHAADALLKLGQDMQLLSLLTEIQKDMPDHVKDTLNEDTRTNMEEIKVLSSGIVDMELQMKAMREASEAITALANEEKLVEARAANRGIRAS